VPAKSNSKILNEQYSNLLGSFLSLQSSPPWKPRSCRCIFSSFSLFLVTFFFGKRIEILQLLKTKIRSHAKRRSHRGRTRTQSPIKYSYPPLQMHFHLFTEKTKPENPKSSRWNYNFEATKARPLSLCPLFLERTTCIELIE
jgi:hypothetical protein